MHKNKRLAMHHFVRLRVSVRSSCLELWEISSHFLSREKKVGIKSWHEYQFFTRRRNDIEIQNLECVWIEITTHNKKVLVGTFYRPPNSPNDTMAHIENSVGLAVDTNIQDILILGDFIISIF